MSAVYCESTDDDVWCCSFASSVHMSCSAVSCLGICTGPRPGTCVDRACSCTVAPQWSAVQWVRLLKNPRAQPNQPWNSGDANGHEGRFGGCCLDQRGHASAGLRWSGGSEGRNGKGGVRAPSALHHLNGSSSLGPALSQPQRGMLAAPPRLYSVQSTVSVHSAMIVTSSFDASFVLRSATFHLQHPTCSASRRPEYRTDPVRLR